jgi:streptomycin 6-kinase
VAGRPHLPLPANLVEATEAFGPEARREWVRSLPEVVPALAQRWSLRLEQPFQPGGQTAWVAPARDADGSPRVLKVSWHYTESAHEADALRQWAGSGAVLLHGYCEIGETRALLLERCQPGSMLAEYPDEVYQDEVVAGLLRRLWVRPPAGHPFRPLQQMCDEWADEFEQKDAADPVPIDRGLARAGIGLFRELPATADDEVLLCTDLHHENVLAAQREPWLVVDPNPYVGDPHYDVLQHMLNSPERLAADPMAMVRRMAALLDLDAERVRLWLFARCVQESPEWRSLVGVAMAVAP